MQYAFIQNFINTAITITTRNNKLILKSQLDSMSIIRYHQEQYSMARSIDPFKTTTVIGGERTCYVA